MHDLLLITFAWLTHWLVHPKMELATVGDDYAVFYQREKSAVVRPVIVDNLKPGRKYHLHGKRFSTLDRPTGKLLCTFATVNDVHIGETKCGYNSKHPHWGPVFKNEEGKPPYAEMMSRNAVMEIKKLHPDMVLVKGDLTDSGTPDEMKRFLEIWGEFGDRLRWVCGNHDVHAARPTGAPQTVHADLPGVTLAMIDTSIEGKPSGRVTDMQLAWLDDVCKHADRPVMIFGHHHLWMPGTKRDPGYFGINPDDSEKLIDLFHRHKCIVGYFAGHTHSNLVGYVAGLPNTPVVECAATKEFPGAWEEYRVYENGIEQIMHRVNAPESLRWEEITSRTELGHYERRHFGRLTDRCFTWIRPERKESGLMQ